MMTNAGHVLLKPFFTLSAAHGLHACPTSGTHRSWGTPFERAFGAKNFLEFFWSFVLCASTGLKGRVHQDDHRLVVDKAYGEGYPNDHLAAEWPATE